MAGTRSVFLRPVSLAIWALFLGAATQVASAAPEIRNLSLRGLQTGATTTVTIDGEGLLPAPRVLLSVPIANQVVKEGATPSRVEIEITLAGDVPPGIYMLRVANAGGISDAVAVGIDDLPEQPVAEKLDQLPVAVNGSISGTQIARTSFTGKAGQQVVVEVEARRLGSALDPIVELYDANRILLNWSQSRPSLAGDARIEATLPADGQYTVELHDVLYRGGNPGHYRLKIGELHYADFTYPMGAQRGTKAQFQLLGRLPSDLNVETDVTGPYNFVAAPVTGVPHLSGNPPRIFVSDFPEVVEAEVQDGVIQEVTVPAVINGRIGAAGQEDRYKLVVQPGAKLRFDVMANRAGSPLDGVLSLRSADGGQLAGNDDRGNVADPGFDYTVPEGVTSVILALSDLQGRGGPEFLYRIAVTPTGQPDFSLELSEERYHVPLAGAALVRVRANRAGYNGAIKLAFNALPDGVLVAGDEIPAGASEALVTLSGFGLRPAQAVAALSGQAVEMANVSRPALLDANNVTRDQPWLRSEIGMALTGPGRVGIAWESDAPALPLGGKYPVQVRVTRAVGVEGAVRLALVTSQIVPEKQEGPNRVPDADKALRLEGTPTIAADQTQGTAEVIVPADLPVIPYDLALRAELLSADGKSVVATAVSPARRITPVAQEKK